MQQYLFSNEINTIAPSIMWNPQRKNFKLTEGMIISIPFHEKTVVPIDAINSLLNKHHFISIEENIFGYEMKNKTFP